jgi:hypothetical protein
MPDVTDILSAILAIAFLIIIFVVVPRFEDRLLGKIRAERNLSIFSPLWIVYAMQKRDYYIYILLVCAGVAIVWALVLLKGTPA